MVDIALARIAAHKAAEICRQFTLPEKDRNLLREEHTPAGFLGALMNAGDMSCAVLFLAHALPRPDAVWWACLCVGAAGGNRLSAAHTAALQAAVQWVVDPSEPNRQAAQARALAAPSSAAGASALAASWSSGSMLPPDQAKVPPSPGMLPLAVHQAVARAALLGAAAQSEAWQRQFLALGIGIANGKYLWNTAPGAQTATRG